MTISFTPATEAGTAFIIQMTDKQLFLQAHKFPLSRAAKLALKNVSHSNQYMNKDPFFDGCDIANSIISLFHGDY